MLRSPSRAPGRPAASPAAALAVHDQQPRLRSPCAPSTSAAGASCATTGSGRSGTPEEEKNDSRRTPRSSPRKLSTKAVLGVGQQLRRGVELLQHAAGVQHRDLVAELDRLVDVVRDEQDRLAQLGLQAQQFGLQVLAHHGVHGAEGLVHQQYRWIGGQRAGDADALLLASGELERVALGVGLLAARRSSAAPWPARAPCPWTSPAAAARSSRWPAPSGAGTTQRSESRSRSRGAAPVRTSTARPRRR